MMSFGALKYFGSVIKKLKKIIVRYQPRDLHLCIRQHGSIQTVCEFSYF